MKKLLCLLLLIALLPLTALAEYPVQGITILDTKTNQASKTITDAAYIDLLMSMLTAPTEICDYRELYSCARIYDVYCHLGDQKYAVYQVFHDDLYNQAWLLSITGDTYQIGCELPLLLNNTLHSTFTFTIPEAHRTLLAEHGWTIAFRHPHMLLQLPARLEASRTDAAALYFTWADLFLRDAGYDITPWLGKAVVPYVYTVYEPVMRSRFFPADSSEVPTSMYAVVLECDGKIIGAYLAARAWDGSWLMSLEGRTASDILPGASRRAYLLSRLPQTQEEQELAALGPEEVIRRYAKTRDPRLMDIDMLLTRLGTASSTLYDSLALLPGQSAGKVLSVSRLEQFGEGAYEAELEDARYFPRIIRESEATGWKLLSFFNTGV